MPFDSSLTLFALAIPPIVVVIFASRYWLKRDPISQPSIVAAIPLGLSSIAILLARSAFLLLHTFSEISSHRTAGVGAVISGLLVAQQPLASGFVDFAFCLAPVFLIAGAGNLAARWVRARYSDGTTTERRLVIPGLSPRVDMTQSAIATIVGVVLIIANV